MDSGKILSICIPTYNRAAALDRLLSILNQEIREVLEHVEIYISDNASTDATQDVLKKWQDVLPLVSRKNEKNVGYDRNAIIVTKMAEGCYLWYMGDDDLITEGSVKKLVRDLISLKQEIGVVYVNQLFRERWVIDFHFRGFRVYRKEELKMPINPSFGGSVCLNRRIAFKVIDELIEEREGKLYKKNFEAFVLHDFVHTYLFLECLKLNGFIGIESDIGMRYMADSGISYKKKLYLELLMLVYVLEMKKYYPWFSHWNEMYKLKSHFARLAIVCENPALEDAYLTNYRALLKALELERKPWNSIIVKLSERMRTLPFSGQAIIVLHKMVRNRFGAKLDSSPDTNPVLDANLSYLMERAHELSG